MKLAIAGERKPNPLEQLAAGSLTGTAGACVSQNYTLKSFLEKQCTFLEARFAKLQFLLRLPGLPR